MVKVQSINDYKTLPDTVGKMRTIGIANDVQRLLYKAEKILRVVKALTPCEAINIIDFSVNRLGFDVLVQMPDIKSLSLPCFTELCKNPTEDGLAGFISSLKKDVTELYKLADVPGLNNE